MKTQRCYYVDWPTPTEAARQHPREDGFYATVIRHLDRPGWVFRFTSGDTRGVHETLTNLNSPWRLA